MLAFRHIRLIGLGLVGASLAHKLRALKAENLFDGEVSAFAPSATTRARAKELGLVDSIVTRPEENIERADLIMLCSPPSTFASVAQTLAPHVSAGAVVSDVGSFKCRAIEDIAPHFKKDIFFIPAHPIAGTEHSGIDAGFASLFEGRWAILTPLPLPAPSGTDAPYRAATQKMKHFWEAMGSKVSFMEAAHHDSVLALTSHLPHIIAWTMVAAAERQSKITKQEVIDFSGGGFKDFTRLASSDPVMWRDVLLGNQKPVLETIDTFIKELETLRAAIDNSDGDFLQALFTQTRSMRALILEAEKKIK